ncbi:hypothetical protein [Persicirhabdus sediminis]|uniref:Uncharacterized protein n=1 Tax=Persicirhabdus sediminis TaxID=454144 RepID=A0A8J7SH67_9BACT|nr:hypothetical protein [Persicirhabdus sediminis]MBK1790590.1 hypothetical protein [Persicirhabdus sediminis]
MKAVISYILLLLITILPTNASSDKKKFEGEFTLKSTRDNAGIQLANEYKIIISGGSATVEYLKDGILKKDQGTVSLTIHNGIDPITKLRPKVNGFIRIEIIKPGWNTDKFVTRFDLQFSAPPASRGEKNSFIFAKETSLEMLWLDKLSDGLTRYSDPMNIRTKLPYVVTIIKSPL